jgi:hypothetical protein
MIRTLGWLNHNGERAFPLAEDSNRIGVSGLDSLTLPNNALLDFYILSYSEPQSQPKLDTVAVDGGGTTVTFTFDYNGVSLVVPVSAAIATPFQAELRTTDAFSNTALLVRPVFGDGVATIAGDVANHGKTFTFTDLLLEPSLGSLQDNHRTTAVFATATPAVRLTGDVLTKEGFNFKTSILPTSNSLRLSAGVGQGEGIPCETVTPPDGECEDAVFFVNGLGPNEFGEFVIQAGPGIEVIANPASNKITLRSRVDIVKPSCRDLREGN